MTSLDNALVTETLNLFEGGPLHRVMLWLGLAGCSRRQITRRILFWVMLLWLPPFALAALDSIGATHSPTVSVFTDLPFHIRYLLSAPILIAAECHLGQLLSGVIPILVARDMILPQSMQAFIKMASRIRGLRNSNGAEFILLLGSLAFVASRAYLDLPQEISSWRQSNSILGTVARIWELKIGLTAYYFLILRWIWKFLIWSYFLIRLAILKPNLQSHHPDHAGGLSFLVYRHLWFGLVAFALSAAISANIGEIVIFSKVSVSTFLFPLIFYLVFIEILLIAPLLCFTPLLVISRRNGLDRYGTFANRYAGDFDRKWVEPDPGETPEALGSPDIQSFNDLGETYVHLREMQSFVMKREHVVTLTILISAPLAPLILFKIPVSEFIKIAAKLIA